MRCLLSSDKPSILSVCLCGKLSLVTSTVLLLASAWALAGPPSVGPSGHTSLPPASKTAKVTDFGHRTHSVGQLALRASNVGVFGWKWDNPIVDRAAAYPSAEWPAGSGNDYLYSAGLWVGGITSDEDTLVTAAVYQGEFFPSPDARDHIREYHQGVRGGSPMAVGEEYVLGDDDDDGLYDEDFPDGYDNDGDGLIDEDFAAYSQQMFACVYYDTTCFFNDGIPDPELRHTPLGLRVEQRSYAWSQPEVDDFIGVDYRVTNIDTARVIYNAYLGLMVDADCGPSRYLSMTGADDLSDYVEIDTVYAPPGAEPETLHISMAYMWDDPEGDDGGDADGIFGVMFLDHETDPFGVRAPSRVEIHAYRNWAGVWVLPKNDTDRYGCLRGYSHVIPTIDRKTSRPRDWRFLISAGPFAEIRPDSSVSLQVAFVVGERDPEMTNYGRSDSEKRKFLGIFLENAIQAQRAFNRSWQTTMPPPPPNQRITSGDGLVVIEWDDFPETQADPFTGILDFAGYRIWKNVGWDRSSAHPNPDDWELFVELRKGELGAVSTGRYGVAKYRYVDRCVKNGFPYWYSVCSFDTGEGQPDALGNRVPMYGRYTQSFELVYPHSASHRTLDPVRVVPNPYRVRAEWDLQETRFEYSGNRICFQNLPEEATIRIYTLAGDLVKVLEHRGPAAEAEACWNLISRKDQKIVSGIYLYHLDSPIGTKIGKFAVIR